MSNTKKATATKTATKNVVTVATKKAVAPEFVELGKSAYHYVRHFLKPLFQENNITIKWVKDAEAYTGVIKVNKADLTKAKKVYTDYIKKEQCVEMITF